MRSAVFAVLVFSLLTPPTPAEDIPAPKAKTPQSPLGTEAYLMPPKEIADAVLGAGRGENVTLKDISPDGKKFVITKTDGMPPIERLACPCVHLAEMAFDPVAGRARDLWVRSAEGFDLFYYADRRTVPIRVPGARVSNPAWSPDGSKLAFFAHFPDATHVLVADAETGSARKVTETPVLATLVTSFQWSKDGKRIQTVLLPDDGKRPVPKADPVSEPKVRVTRGGTNPSRTYRYLLESPHDVRLLEHLVTGQVAVIDIADGRVTKVGEPAMVRSVSMAPGGEQFRVATVKKPFSYYAPFTRFGSAEGVWDVRGKNLVTLNDRPLREAEPAPAAVTTQPAAGQPTTGTGGGKGGGKTGRFGQGKGAATTPKTDPDPDPTAPPKVDPDPTDPRPDPDPRIAPAPFDPDARRDIAWRPDGAGLSFLQMEPARTDAKDTKDAKDSKDAQNGKEQDAKDAKGARDPKAAGETRKDRVMLWVSPFGKDDTKVVYETPNRITGAQYSADGKWMFLTQTVDAQRQITAVDLKDPKTSYVVYKSGRSAEPAPPPARKEADDDEQQPFKGGKGPGAIGGLAAGGLMTQSGPSGVPVVRVSGAGEVYMSGSDRAGGGTTKPYLDKIAIATGKKTRVFEGKGDTAETIDAVDADDVTKVFTTRQKSDVVPDSYVTDLATGQSTKLTDNVDGSPWFHKLKVDRFQVTRVDGFKFWVKVTTAPDAKGKLPALFWIYPREYTDQAAYSASAGRAGGAGPGAGAGGGGRFTSPNPRSMAILTLAGYALVEPDVPIVGPAGRMNDNYVPDLRNSLWAAIDECDKRGIIDRDRLACGGHSYGAFSTANAMAHTPFFKAGIAGDGNYNRTLTSMTFQTERRQLWDARETYLEMSPLLWANRVNGALLMYHGKEDANVGTNPINAEHLFAALDGLGKPAALYMYPYEGHGPMAKETTLDLWARWVAWLDTHVKNPKKVEATKK
jgi:dipeptidyl aminopeptidase/acylaminoacyl peptidase